MAKITAAKQAQFVDPELETFVIANTPAAYEALDPRMAEHPTCVVCGSPLKDVFVTNYGPMGGDCFATLSGNPETRRAYRKMLKLFDQVERWGGAQWSLWGHQIMWMQIEVQKSFRQAQPLVWVRLHQYDSESRREYDRNIGFIPEQPGVVEYLEGWAAEHGIHVVPKGYRDNPVASVTDAKLATLTKLEQDDAESFATWVKEEAQADDRVLQDRDGRADLIADWIQETCNLSVRDDGLIEFWRLTEDDDCDVAYTIGDLPVVVYHHTATGALPGIIERGGLAPAINLGYKATKHDSGQYVFVTTELMGPAVDGYVRRAVRRFGGHPVTLEIRSYLHRLAPDPDDADISSGRTQFVLPYVDLKDIVSGLERSPCAPLVDRFLPNG